MGSVRILFCGDVKGNFRILFSRVKELHQKKGPFEALCCVGNFFGPNTEEYEELKSGKIEVPILTYILNGNQSIQELYEPLEKAVPKIVFLGKMGCITLATGLKIAYLSGVELPESLREDESAFKATLNKYNIYISEYLVKIMTFRFLLGVDILLTSVWPKDVTKYGVSIDKDYESKINEFSSSYVSYVAKQLKPRYHFCGLSDFYYERAPYRNHVDLLEKPVNLTRFIGLAAVKEKKRAKNEKWLYGISLVPRKFMSAQKLAESCDSSTVSPYSVPIKDDNVNKNFFFEDPINNPRPSTSKKRSLGENYENRPKKPPIDTSTCWFCLSNPNVERQLIITVGNFCYITLVKGVLVPYHVCIVPVDHIASSVELSHDALKEMDDFKTALSIYFHDDDKDVIFFERSHYSPHLQLQVIPIPKLMQNEVKEKLYSYASKFDVKPLPTSANIKEVVTSGESKNFFYFEHMINKKTQRKYIAFIDKSVKDFPLQIGRHILADVLGLGDRKNWQSCVDPIEEKKMAAKMREDYKKFDFSNRQ